MNSKLERLRNKLNSERSHIRGQFFLPKASPINFVKVNFDHIRQISIKCNRNRKESHTIPKNSRYCKVQSRYLNSTNTVKESKCDSPIALKPIHRLGYLPNNNCQQQQAILPKKNIKPSNLQLKSLIDIEKQIIKEIAHTKSEVRKKELLLRLADIHLQMIEMEKSPWK
eukprot:NODE_3_length_80033_cov_0.932970.p53 type:complete len:169 gc:universal NODE_3_length_80033_cov_0.932970:45910-46416(+)